MYSNNLFPVITNPSRITIDTAALIDNIFTKTLESQVTAELLINDISNHLPFFSIFQQLHKMETINRNYAHVLTRYRTPEAINAQKADLNSQT